MSDDQKWEHYVVAIPTGGVRESQKTLKEIEKEGWELVAVYEKKLYFKRPFHFVGFPCG